MARNRKSQQQPELTPEEQADEQRFMDELNRLVERITSGPRGAAPPGEVPFGELSPNTDKIQIPDDVREAHRLLMAGAAAGRLAVTNTKDLSTGREVYIVAIHDHKENGICTFTPVARLESQESSFQLMDPRLYHEELEKSGVRPQPKAPVQFTAPGVKE